MRLPELRAALEASGLPVAYRAWPENAAPPLPFICYLVTGSNNLHADGEIFYSALDVQVELYTRVKDPEAEARVETALQGFAWEKTETYIGTERCYMILYEIEV